MTVELKQSVNAPTDKDLDRCANWIMLVPDPVPKTMWPRVPGGEVIKKHLGRLDKPAKNDPVILDLPNKQHSRLCLACIKHDVSPFELLTLARKLVKAHLDFHPRVLSIMVMGFDGIDTERMIESLITAVLAATAELPRFRKKIDKYKPVKEIRTFGCLRKDEFARSFAIAEGNALTRRLSMLPSNKLRPTEYRKELQKLAKQNNWDYRFYGINELKKLKAGAFLAVTQASPVPDAGIVRLTCRPRGAGKRTLALVGKGICYDTGGSSLKPPKYMFGMHEDMQGSAVALGTLLALSQLKVDFTVECWLALAMNHIGPKAYQPNDVVTACDGTNIEVVNTDAEGRMVLSDTLVIASRENPDVIIDYATLTGACVYSLGTAYSGVFTNRDTLLGTLIEAGRDSGERVWPFPMDEDYDEALKSEIADVKQCALEGNADHILASRFLQRFVKNNTPWIHVDLSSSNRKGGLAHIPTDTTGFGIRFTLDLVLDKQIFKAVKKVKSEM